MANNKKKKRAKKTQTKHNHNIERWVIVPDIHASVSGEHDADSLATVAEFMASRRFDGYLNLGDLIDFSIISSHNIGNLRDVEGGRILEEYRVLMPSSPNMRRLSGVIIPRQRWCCSKAITNIAFNDI
jgi:hypothetical protein